MLGRLITKTATLVVNDAEDGFLSTVNDVAIADVSEMSSIQVSVNHLTDNPGQTNGTQSELDLSGPGTNVDTVIQAVDAGLAGDDITITFVDGGSGVGLLTRTGLDFTFTFENGVTTVEDFEDAVAALTGADALIEVKTPGTPAATLATTDDEFGPTNLAGGADGEGQFTIVIEKSIDGVNFAPVATIDETDFADGDNVSSIFSIVDGNNMPLRTRQLKFTLTALDDDDKFSVVVNGAYSG